MFDTERIAKLNEERLSNPKNIAGLVVKVWALIKLAKKQGYPLLVTTAYRSIAEQNKLYAQGRTTPGKIVTNAKGGQSKHNKGEAVDLAFVINDEIVWDIKYYKLLRAWCVSVGLKWGGNWKKFKDYPHVEI